MGLFDGAGYDSGQGSAAQIAALLGAPVLLVMSIAGSARSAAAVALGFARFDPDAPVAAVALNFAGSAGHAQGCAGAITAATGLPVPGWLPREAALRVPERHLGLLTAAEGRRHRRRAGRRGGGSGAALRPRRAAGAGRAGARPAGRDMARARRGRCCRAGAGGGARRGVLLLLSGDAGAARSRRRAAGVFLAGGRGAAARPAPAASISAAAIRSCMPRRWPPIPDCGRICTGCTRAARRSWPSAAAAWRWPRRWWIATACATAWPGWCRGWRA